MRWRLSHVYYERIPFLRLSACTTWFCSVRRPVDVLFEYYQSRKCSWIEKNPNFIALCFKIIQRSPPQSPSQREITCQTFVSVVEIDMLPNCQSVDKMSQSLLASQHADVARFACLLANGSCQGREDSWRTGFGTWQPTGGSFPSERRTLPRVRAAAGRRVLCCVQLMPHSRY